MSLRTRLLVACALAVALTACTTWRPLTDQGRVTTYSGFSYLPPQSPDWLVRAGEYSTNYLKHTDTKTVSFFVGATDGPLREKVESKEALIGVARWLKDKPEASDPRYTERTSSFRSEENGDCVRYEMTSHDTQAANKGAYQFLVLRSVGRFCVSPKNRSKVIDIYYSIRHTPTLDPIGLVGEGEAFIASLQLPPP